MTVQFTINGVRVEAEEGDNVLDTARRYGFDVPSLCHHNSVTPYGACRVCLVEITKGGRKKLTTSCNYEVQDGIEVLTDGDEIYAHRAMVLELILANVPESAPILELAAEYGIDVARFKGAEPAEKCEPENCILCGLCVRVCEEVIGASALSFTGRGDRKGVGVPYGDGSSDCIGCGSCAAICPTKCIPVDDSGGNREIWGRSFEMVRCDSCGGPVMTVDYRDYAVAKRPLPESYYTTCSACKKDQLAVRFGKVGS